MTIPTSGSAFRFGDVMIDTLLESQLIDYNKYRLHCFKNFINYKENKELQSILNKRYCKNSRIKKRLVYLITHFSYLYFLTFTFDDTLIQKCDRTKRDLIKNTLYGFDEDIKIILNIDYGSRTEREHYHCIVATNSVLNLDSYLRLVYPCFSTCKKIRTTFSDCVKLSKYINKLANHCTKDSTKKFRIYYNFKGYDEIDDCDDRFKKYCRDKFKLYDTLT